MKLPRDQLVSLGLCVLDDTVLAARKAPVQPTEALRLALAIFFALSDGPLFDWPDHRTVFDRFWRIVTGHEDEHPTQVNCRVTHATTYLNQIERQVRQSDELARARVLRERRHLAQAVLDTSTAREPRIDDERRYYWSPPLKGMIEG